MTKRNQLFIAIGILIAFIVVSAYFLLNRPQTKQRRGGQTSSITVEVTPIKPQPYQVKISSFGVVKPRTKTRLFPQVSAQVVNVSDHFREGGFFEKGEVLLRLDDRDSRAQLTIVKAERTAAEQRLEEEKARVKQAREDWKRLGKSSSAPELVLRKPQLAAAKAALAAAEAKVTQAEINLERTNIVAPYAGRVLLKSVDVGQYVSPGTSLGEIYATDYVEIRLPLLNNALRFLDLPETLRDQSHRGSQPLVTFSSRLGNHLETWQGRIVRTEGAIDENTHQLYVIAQINDPYGKSEKHAIPLKIGQYLEATIEGNWLTDALVVPEKMVYQESYVYLFKSGAVYRQPIEIAWRYNGQLVIDKGLAPGDQLVTTLLGQVISGTRVKLKGAKPEHNRIRKKQRPEFQKLGAKRP
ncbi:MAG TPA: efflux RND transporter periplasmic adaptor subunit [Aeromonadales bacterium]|nr:efflux RND transporter periplasmic adaptor subunit [Aeromonadales bacterium]